MSKRPENPYKDHPVLGTRPLNRRTNEEAGQIMLELCEFHGIPESEQDALAGWKLAICLAHLIVPALRPRKPSGRPRDHSPHDVAWALLEFCKTRDETGLRSTKPIIEKMAEDDFWQDPDIALGKTKKEVLQRLRYMLIDRLFQPDFTPKVSNEIRDNIAAMEEIMKSNR